MKKWFLIKYEADTGCKYIGDTALIEAENKNEAKECLKKYVGGFGNDYGVSDIYKIEEFNGNIFTGKFGFR